jgi:hypothetical protein
MAVALLRNVCGHHYNGQVIRPMTTILYARVSSADQTVAHRRKQPKRRGSRLAA